MGDNPDITEEWAQRILCAIEGVPFENSNYFVIHAYFRDAKKKKSSSPCEPVFWIGISSR